MLLPSLTGVVEAASDFKGSNTEKIVASQKSKIEEKKKEFQEDKAEVKEEKTKPEAKEELEDILTADEVQEIRNRTNNLENDYFFNDSMLEELKAELRKAKADPSVNYQEVKARLINEAIIKNTPAQKAPGEDRAVKKFNIKDADKLEAGMTEINVRGLGMKTGQIIEVLVNGKVKGSYTQEERVKGSVIITISEALKEGDKVKAILKGSDDVQIAETSEATAKKKEPKKAEKYKDTLKMPTGDFWLEQYVSNIVNEEEKEEALDLIKKANTSEIANDISSVDFVIEGETSKTAYYTVTYKDNSKSDKISAPNLTVKQVTEYSAATNVEKIVVTDTKITGKLLPQKRNEEGKFVPDPAGKIADGTKVIAILNPSGNDGSANYCTTGKCTTDKNSSQLGEATVNSDGTFEINVPNGFDYKQEVGLTVKEPHKFKACNSTTVEYVIPNVPVRDPKKLTDEEKKEIIKQIREANKVNGVSKLPDGNPGTDYEGIPAVIEIDNQGNVKIISVYDVEVKWEGGKPIVQKNDDGTVKVQNDKKDEVVPVEKEKLLTNLAPKSPAVGYDKTKGEITVTPDKADTDAKTITVKYKDPEGNDQEVTITKADGENGKWSAPAGSKVTVNPDTGVVSIKDSDIQNKTNVSATVTDEGGINTVVTDDDKAKTSDNKSETIKIYPKKPTITINDKDGSVTITPVDKDNDKVAKKMDITYTPAGKDETKTVTVDRDKYGNLTLPEGTDFKVSEDGKSITITNDKIKSKTDITAKTNDGDTNEKLESVVATEKVPDKNAPQPPTVEVDVKTGKASITPPTDSDVKIIEVKYIGTDGQVKTAKAEKTGENKWKVTGEGASFNTAGCIFIPHANLKRASEITAIATDEDGNKSTEGIDTSLPPAPTAKESEGVITVTPPENTPAVNGMEITYTPDGSEETKTFKVVKGTDDKWKIDGDNTPDGVTVNDNGTVTIADGTAKEKSKVTVISSIDTNKKSLEKGEAQVPEAKAPEAPEVKVQKDGSVKITPKDKGETTVTVTYKDKAGNAKTATATKGKNGKWTVAGTNGEEINEDSGVITIPEGKTNPGDRVRVTASKGSKTSTENNDLTKPAPPTVTPKKESGDVTITPPTNGNVDGMIIKYKKIDGSDGTITVKKGEGGIWTFEGDAPEGVEVAGDTGVVTIKKGHAKEKTPVTANSTIETLQTPDKNQGEQPELVPDKTNPQPPTVKIEDNGSITITPPTDQDTTSVTVNYKDKTDTDKAPKAKKNDTGKWTIENNDNGETVDPDSGVITIPKGNYKTGEAVTAYGNDDAQNKSTNDNKTPVEVTFNVNGASKNIDSSILVQGGNFVLPAIFEAKYYPTDKLFAGWKVDDETELKQANTSITVNKDTKITAVWKDIEYKVTFDANGGSKTMESQNVKKGERYTLPANGFIAPKDKEFDGWMVGTEKKAVGDKITVNENTEVKAIWKDKTTTDPSQPGGETTPGENPGTSPENPNPQNPSQPDNPTDTPPTVNENPDGSTNVTPGKNTDKMVIPNTDKNGENPDVVVVEKGEDGKWENKNDVPGVTVDPDTGKTTIPADRKVDKDHIISESKPKVKPEDPSYEENEIPEIKIRDHYTPTFPVYVTVPKTEKVEKAEEVPVSLETHKAYIAGYEDNTLRAEGNLTRAEAAAMVTRLAGFDLSDNSMPAFKDMQKNAWYFRYINAAVKANMLDADNGMMRPSDKITRAEFAKMLAAIDKENSSVSKFDDIKGHRYEKEINKIYGNNRIEGYEDGSFRPDAYLTRAESAAFLNRMFNRIADKEAYAGLEDKLARFKDFDASKWYYDEMVEATNSHELTRRGKASDKFGRVYEKWTRILPSDVK